MNQEVERLKGIREGLKSKKEEMIERAVAVYLNRLDHEKFPSQFDLEVGCDAAETILKDSILSPTLLSDAAGRQLSNEELTNLTFDFNRTMPSLIIPPPAEMPSLTVVRLSLAGAIGAVAGMAVLTPFATSLLQMRDTGLFVGAPLGAFLLVWATWKTAYSKTFKRWLITLLCVATIAEFWGIFSGGFGSLWKHIGGRRTGVMRIMVYVAILLLLLAGSHGSQPKYDRGLYETTVKISITVWMESCILAIWGFLGGIGQRNAQDGTRKNYQEMLCKLVDRIQSLKNVHPEHLNGAIQELNLEARNLGFQSESASSFKWSDDLQSKYDVFGHVEPGDFVTAEHQPVLFDGKIEKKGLVRKIRERN